MTLKEVLDKTINFFKQKNMETPRLDAELLLAHGLGIERIQLYLKFDQPLKDNELEKLREFVKRRSQGEPIAYILGEKDFYRSTFHVSPAVLIPRPETETLVDISLEVLEKNERSKILDLAAGSGCIGISLGKEKPLAEVFAVEKSPQAFEVLKLNAETILQEKIKILCADADNDKLVEEFTGKDFDLIVSNPPYIASDDPEVSEHVRKFEPSMALFAEEQGKYFILSWARKYFDFLKPDGVFIFEIGYKQGPELKKIISDWNCYKSTEILQDLSGKDRFLKLTK